MLRLFDVSDVTRFGRCAALGLPILLLRRLELVALFRFADELGLLQAGQRRLDFRTRAGLAHGVD